MTFPDLSKAYLFKFKKKPVKDVENIMLKTSAYFELYIPYEESELQYVVGAVFSEQEVNNWIKHFKELDEELERATPEEFNKLKSLVGYECSYMRNINSSIEPSATDK